MMKLFLPFCCLSLFSVACTSEPAVEEPAGLYQNYQVWGEEGREEVTVRLQFYEGGKNGNAIALPGFRNVYLDHTLLPVDSTRFNGVYYELAVPADDFKGKHTIRFVATDEKEYSETFRFEPFSLAEELPEALKKAPFELRLKNLPEKEGQVRLVMVDTSMASADVNEDVMAENGRISITEDYLANLTEGPIYLEIYHEQERPVENKAPGGGKILVTYAVKRQFSFLR
jgi:hypothetical protein